MNNLGYFVIRYPLVDVTWRIQLQNYSHIYLTSQFNQATGKGKSKTS